MAQLKEAGTIGLGALSTLGARTVLDQQGNDSILRPSVLVGVGVGGAALASAMLVNNGTIGAPVGSRRGYTDMVYTLGYSALLTGLFSAFVPKGTSKPGLPSV